MHRLDHLLRLGHVHVGILLLVGVANVHVVRAGGCTQNLRTQHGNGHRLDFYCACDFCLMKGVEGLTYLR